MTVSCTIRTKRIYDVRIYIYGSENTVEIKVEPTVTRDYEGKAEVGFDTSAI
ncbi:MAG: hypothetical protein ACXACY_14780 [Candidatus Hodarchaeales archaeon]|jgi:hypothetical protein